jgi:hypothetical protein
LLRRLAWPQSDPRKEEKNHLMYPRIVLALLAVLVLFALAGCGIV